MRLPFTAAAAPILNGHPVRAEAEDLHFLLPRIARF